MQKNKTGVTELPLLTSLSSDQRKTVKHEWIVTPEKNLETTNAGSQLLVEHGALLSCDFLAVKDSNRKKLELFKFETKIGTVFVAPYYYASESLKATYIVKEWFDTLSNHEVAGSS